MNLMTILCPWNVNNVLFNYVTIFKGFETPTIPLKSVLTSEREVHAPGVSELRHFVLLCLLKFYGNSAQFP